jgi:hypothetical protein
VPLQASAWFGNSCDSVENEYQHPSLSMMICVSFIHSSPIAIFCIIGDKFYPLPLLLFSLSHPPTTFASFEQHARIERTGILTVIVDGVEFCRCRKVVEVLSWANIEGMTIFWVWSRLVGLGNVPTSVLLLSLVSSGQG